MIDRATQICHGLMAGALLVALAAPSAARVKPAPVQGPVLWEQLRSGMSPREVRGLWRHSRVSLGDSCVASVKPAYLHGRLAFVTISGSSSRGDGDLCAQRVAKTLADKYGAEDRALENAIALGGSTGAAVPGARARAAQQPDRYLTRAWASRGISILYQARLRGGPWSISYAPNATALRTDAL